MGRLTADPEIKDGTYGTFTVFTVASTNPKTNANDEETTSFVKCKFNGKRGETFAKYHNKGTNVHLVGQIYLRDWTSNDGKAGKDLQCEVLDFHFVPKGAANTTYEDAPAPTAGRATSSSSPAAVAVAPAGDAEYDPFAS